MLQNINVKPCFFLDNIYKFIYYMHIPTMTLTKNMKNLNDVLWTDEDYGVITIYGVITKPCQINEECGGGAV